jgi:glycosyltransferase involved in cell wall biosynthesis
MTARQPDREPVRVLQLTKGLGPGGAERLLVTFAGLADHDQVELRAAYLLPWKDHLVPELERLGVPVTCLDGGRIADPRWALRLRRLVRREQVEVVHVHSPLVAAVARVALRFPGRQRPAVVGTEHNVWSSHHPATRWANRLTRPLERATLAVSEQVRASMPKRAAAHTEVLLHGADVEGIAARRPERDRAKTELGLAPEDIVVVTVANLRANKDYPTMLRAALLLRERVPRMRFLSVGQGPLVEELAALRDDLGLGDGFRFLGHREDPIWVLEAGDVFCLSSRYEGLSIALIEAMAAGLPVVATAVGGTPTVVRDGIEGRLVPAGDPTALADALVELADPVVRAGYGTAAAARARDFGAQHAVARQQELYRTLVGRAGP